MHQMANVQQQPLIWIYPEIGLPSLRHDFNWIFLPKDKMFWLQDNAHFLWTEVFLTSLNLDHFVAVVKYVTNIVYVKI